MDRIRKLTDRELIRLYRTIHKRIEQWGRGGLLYGWDWPTLRVCHPHTARVLADVITEGKRRGL
jgi:hypothetical protein